MGVEKLTPRNPNALAGRRLRGVPNSQILGIGASKDSLSPHEIQVWAMGDQGNRAM